MFTTARVTQPLGLKREPFAAPQFMFCLLAVFNISGCSVPFDNLPGFVAQGAGTEEKPAILSVEAAEPRFDFTGLARTQDGVPVFYKSVQIVRMHGSRPPPILCLFRGETGIIQPTAVEEFRGAVGTSRPDQRRDRIDHLPELAFGHPHASASSLR